MKQQISWAGSKEDPVKDYQVVFCALYNLLYEKVQEEPRKGIIVSKGNTNQRKVKWSSVLRMSHMLEDFFIMRAQREGAGLCQTCRHWTSLSEASPWIGECQKKHKRVHTLERCKRWEESS